jgi:hypothetical protein
MSLPTDTTPVLTFLQGLVFLSFVIGGSLLAGVIVIWARQSITNKQNPSDPSASVIRSWIAISLVFGLLVFCTAAFVVGDDELRNTLLGGFIASVSAAVTFYFSSKSTDQAVSAVVAMSQGPQTSSNTLAAPPSGTVNKPYTYKFSANGLQSATFLFAQGSTNEPLPDDLTLDTDGTLHGTPKEAGTSSFKIIATTPDGASFSQPVTLIINGDL